jgi:hypothetical protein
VNVVAGSLLLVFAAVVLGATAGLEKLAAGELGPGFFPVLSGMLLAGVGVVLVVTGLRGAAQSSVAHLGHFESGDFLRAAAITGSVLLFAMLLKPAGLTLTLVASIWLSTRASSMPQRVAAKLCIPLGVLLTAFFVVGLGLPVPALPDFLR